MARDPRIIEAAKSWSIVGLRDEFLHARDRLSLAEIAETLGMLMDAAECEALGRYLVSGYPVELERLFPREALDALLPLGSTQGAADPACRVRLSCPGLPWAWYPLEFNGQDIFYGFADTAFPELGFTAHNYRNYR